MITLLCIVAGLSLLLLIMAVRDYRSERNAENARLRKNRRG